MRASTPFPRRGPLASRLPLLLAFTLLAGCASGARTPPVASAPAQQATGRPAALDSIAEAYVKLVLGVGEHDEGYVDAYYGPPEWRAEVEAAPPSLEELRADASSLLARVRAVAVPAGADELVRLRRDYLERQVEAVEARIRMLGGERLTFDEESQALYDAVAPHYPDAHYDSIRARLDAIVPGTGPLAERVGRFQSAFIIPPERLDTVFQAALAEARRRTRAHIELPAGESFRIEYVTGKPWAGYNWYQGDYQSLIQVNVDYPITIDRAVDLAAHEGYPGHHVYNVLLEKELVDGRGWVEYSVYPLYSPQSLIAEGTANYGIQVAFPGAERETFERDVLFPLAGLAPADASRYYEVLRLLEELSFARNEAARRYLDGEWTREQAAEWLTRHSVASLAGARASFGFVDVYRSYVINYNWGQELVRRYIERRVAEAAPPGASAAELSELRWREFERLISSPRLPSGLR